MGKLPESFIPMPSGRPACIALFADSHGNRRRFARAIEIAADKGPVDAALQLGDHASDAVLLGEMRPDWPFFAVRGNNDYMDQNTPSELLLSVGERKIYASHGHYHSASVRTEKLAQRALSMGADVAAYGHTHVAQLDVVDGITVINPGSVSLPRDGNDPCFALLYLTEDGTDPQFYHFKRP